MHYHKFDFITSENCQCSQMKILDTNWLKSGIKCGAWSIVVSSAISERFPALRRADPSPFSFQWCSCPGHLKYSLEVDTLGRLWATCQLSSRELPGIRKTLKTHWRWRPLPFSYLRCRGVCADRVTRCGFCGFFCRHCHWWCCWRCPHKWCLFLWTSQVDWCH